MLLVSITVRYVQQWLILPESAVAGEFELVFGTSCSSPVVGSMITLVNDARIAAGKGPVGT